jgi:hypothetical protein
MYEVDVGVGTVVVGTGTVCVNVSGVLLLASVGVDPHAATAVPAISASTANMIRVRIAPR